MWTFDAGGILLHLPVAGIWDFSKCFQGTQGTDAGNVGLDTFARPSSDLDIGNHTVLDRDAVEPRGSNRSAQEVPVQFIKEAEGYSTTIAAALDPPRAGSGCTWTAAMTCQYHGRSHVAAAVGTIQKRRCAGRCDASTGRRRRAFRGSRVSKMWRQFRRQYPGRPCISGWIMTMDLAHQRLWIAPAGKRTESRSFIFAGCLCTKPRTTDIKLRPSQNRLSP